MTARPLFIAWKADGSELLCLDQSDIISVISAKTFKVVRKHKYGSQVRPSSKCRTDSMADFAQRSSWVNDSSLQSDAS